MSLDALSPSTHVFRSNLRGVQNPYVSSTDPLRDCARDTIRNEREYAPSPFAERHEYGWTTSSFADDVRFVRAGQANPMVTAKVREFFAWRAQCLSHEARELGKLEHMLRVWDRFDKQDASIGAFMINFFKTSWGLPFSSRPAWSALDRLGRKRVQEMSPLTPDLRSL